MDDSGQYLGCWQFLPAGLLQVVSNHLPWSDVLSSRLACTHWRAALESLITQLRVHVAAGCSNTGRAAGQMQHPGEVLHAGLQRLPCVASVQLMPTEHTTAADLAAVLDVVAVQGQVQEVVIWEVDPIHKALKARSFASSLQLHKLQHIRQLTIRSPVTWSLEDVWQQVAVMAADEDSSQDGSSGSSLQQGSHGILQPIDNSSSSAPSCVANNGSRQPALESLTIHSVSLLSQQHTCRFPGKQISSTMPPNLRRLVTPLPGQKDKQGAVVCNLAQSHERYVQGIAAALPQLESLRLLGSFEGDTKVFGGLGQLTDLQLGVGGVLRALQDLVLAEDEFALARPLLRLEHLQRLTLAGSDSTHMPVKLEWLKGVNQLQHLSACMVQSSQVGVSAMAPSQLRSLSCRLLLQPSSELLAQVVAVGQQLTSLTLSRGDPGGLRMRRPSRVLRPSLSLQPHLPSFSHLHSLCLLSGSEHLVFTIQHPAVVWHGLPLLQQLRLQGVGLGYGVDSKPLPHKQVKVKLSSSQPSDLGLGGDGLAGLLRRHEDNALAVKVDELVVLWLQDLPPGLQQLELGRYAIVLGQDQQGPTVGSQEQQRRQLTTDLGLQQSSMFGSLESLMLANCCVLQQVPGQAMQGEVTPDSVRRAVAPAEGTGAASSSSAQLVCPAEHHSSAGMQAANAVARFDTGPKHVSLAPTQRLLQCLAASKQLSEMRLLQIPLLAGDVGFICTQLGRNLRCLHLQGASWAPVGYADQISDAAGHVADVAAAAECGQLRQLQDLALRFGAVAFRAAEEAPGCSARAAVGALGVEMLRACCGFTALRHLNLELSLRHCKVTLGGEPGLVANAGGNAGSSSSSSSSSSCSNSDNVSYSTVLLPALSEGGLYDKLEAPSSSTVGNNGLIEYSVHHRQVNSSAYIRQELHACMSSMLTSWLCCCSGRWELTNLQHLCGLGVSLHVPPLRVMGDLAPGVLGRCRRCGGGVGLEAVRWFFKQGLPAKLPTCEVQYEEVSNCW